MNLSDKHNTGIYSICLNIEIERKIIMLLALKVFGIGAVISYGIAVLMKVTMACISAMTKEKEVQK